MDASLAQLRDRIVAANASKTPMRVRGAGTKDFYGESFEGEMLDTRGHRGIVAYEPSELVITARCGTPLSEIDAALESHGQFLPFVAPRFGGDPTIGGVVVAGLSGPRRASVGSVRDFVLGTHLLNANGDELKFGGQVMKNVAGFDVSRLLCGSLGILGLITQVSLKVLPKPRAETTLRFEMSAIEALDRFNTWRGQPVPVVATAWADGIAHVKLAGAASAIMAAQATLGGETVANDDIWRSLRDQTHTTFSAARLWRLSVPTTATFLLPGVTLIEWSGGQRWLAGDAAASDVRDAAASVGGSATLWRGERDTTMFHPLKSANLELHRKLKHAFDPNGIFNRGRLIPDL
jgi:glycolate oxidase FAD binding subunit